jgi:hypothetical protein
MSRELDGKVANFTGAATASARAIAFSFGEAGAHPADHPSTRRELRWPREPGAGAAAIPPRARARTRAPIGGYPPLAVIVETGSGAGGPRQAKPHGYGGRCATSHRLRRAAPLDVRVKVGGL